MIHAHVESLFNEFNKSAIIYNEGKPDSEKIPTTLLTFLATFCNKKKITIDTDLLKESTPKESFTIGTLIINKYKGKNKNITDPIVLITDEELSALIKELEEIKVLQKKPDLLCESLRENLSSVINLGTGKIPLNKENNSVLSNLREQIMAIPEGDE